MAELNGWRDPFDVPAHLLPPGMIYQWCAKEVRGAVDRQYQQMLEAGWMPVPRLRHGDFFGEKYQGDNGSIQFGGQVLMERPRTESKTKREDEIDQACVMGQRGRLVVVETAIPIRLSVEDLRMAQAQNLVGSEYAIHRIRLAEQGIDENVYLRGRAGAFDFCVPPRVVGRHCRWPALDWLFNLISREEEMDDDE